MSLLLFEHPEQFIANNKNLGRAYHTFASLGVGGTVALAGTLASTGVGVASAAGAFGGGGGGAAGGGKVPNYKASKASTAPVTYDKVGFNPVSNVGYNPTQGSEDLLANYPNLAQFAQAATAFRTAEREKIMPGSANQFSLASGVLQDWLGGNVGKDVVDFTNRTVAERTGGGFNPWTGGGNSQQAFARSIGKLSSDFQQMGISAAPAWQQLANSFVVGVEDTARLALGFSGQRYSYDALNANINQFNSEGNLKAGMFNSEMDVKTQMANQQQGNYLADQGYISGMNNALWNQNAANQQVAQDMGWASLAANAATGIAGSMAGYRSPTTNTASSAAWTPKPTGGKSTYSGNAGTMLF